MKFLGVLQNQFQTRSNAGPIAVTAGISSTKEHKDNSVAAKEGRPPVLG